MKENICTKLRFPSNWKKLGVTSLMVFLCISLFASEPIDFDKAFKESARIEKQIKRTSFPKRTFLILILEQKRMMRLILAMKPLIRLFYSAVCQEVVQ